jgi:AcrR family transcriptional regulator
MASRTDGQTTRDRILIAASSVVHERGPAKLTIESAAEAAGLSKGAVLYHFATKDSLIDAMVVRVMDQFDATTDAIAKNDNADPGRYTRAYVRAMFFAADQNGESAAGMFAAIANNVDLLAPATERHEKYEAKFDHDGIAPEVALLARLAVDGLFFAEAFKLAPPNEAMKKKVLSLILSLVSEPQLKPKLKPKTLK